jgi:hypothetical protein
MSNENSSKKQKTAMEEDFGVKRIFRKYFCLFTKKKEFKKLISRRERIWAAKANLNICLSQ